MRSDEASSALALASSKRTAATQGSGLAFVAALRRYRLVLTMPEDMSSERVALLQHLGVEVHLTPGILMTDAIARATQLARSIPGAVQLDQFTNPANPGFTGGPPRTDRRRNARRRGCVRLCRWHRYTGVCEVLKARRPTTRIIAVEPSGAAVLSDAKRGATRCQVSASVSFRAY